MSFNPTRRAFLLATVGTAVVSFAGCKSKQDTVRTPAPYEGQYKNAKGAVVLEIKDNAIQFTDPKTRTKSEVPFMIAGDKLVVESNAGNFTLTVAPDGSITGLPATIAGGTEPLKKAS